MKKLFKKSIACLIAVLMVVSSMPFTAITAFAADANYTAVKNAIDAYENKMNGTVYTNMQAAYSAYVSANSALKDVCEGKSVDLAAVASDLSKKTKNMGTYTAPSFTTVAPKFPSNDVGQGYYGNIIYSNSSITDISGKSGIQLYKYNWNSYEYYLYAKMHCNNDVVLVYNGNKDDVVLPITIQIQHSRSGLGKSKYRTFSVYSSQCSWTLYRDWFGNSGSWNSWPTGTATLNYLNEANNDKSHFYNGQETFYFGNSVKYSGNPDTTVYYNHYNKASDISFYVYSRGDENPSKDKHTSISPIVNDGDANIYVLNYKGFQDVVNGALTGVDVKNYKQGGLNTYLSKVDEATTYGPNNAVNNAASGSAVATAFSEKVTGYKKTFASKPAKDAELTITHDGSTVTSWTTTKEANCTEEGSKEGTCQYCDQKVVQTIKAKGHTEVTDEAVAPNCTETGLTEGKHCSVCGTITVAQKTLDALGHDMKVVEGSAKDPTCTETGKKADKKCSRCNYTEPGATIDAKGHIEEVIPAVEATCTTGGSTAGTKCSVCGVIIVAPETIPAKGHSYNYTYNNNSTHKKVCKNCDESSIEACSNELKKPGTTSDTWHCTVCGHEYQRAVSEKGTLIAAIDALKNDVNADDAEYRYTSEAINKANGVIESAQLVLNDRYADQKTVVDAMVSKVASEKTDLNSNGLAKYTVTFEVVNDDNGETVARDVNPDVTYGTVLDFNENLLVDKDGNSLVVYKWKKRDANNNDTVLNSTSKDFSVVVKENATYFCYVLNSKASDETNTKTRVRYIDKSGKTIKIDFATVGDSYTVDNNVKAPKIPYYKFTEWNLIYGDDVSVGTRELVYQAQYEYDEVKANNCTIIGLNGVYVNGSNQCTSRYDDKVMLTGADETDKYAFCDSTGNTIISYINNDYIHTPHLNGTVVYITKVKVPTTDATTAVTGYFTQPGTPFNTLYVNAQYYLPEGATTVEAGIVISRLQTTTDTLQIGNAGVAKVESNSQGSNHEYSIGMTYSASATYYSRSYLIYKLADGTTKTVYSNDVTIINV